MERIYDIGANIGRFTEVNLTKYKNCEFIVVEANPNLIPILEKKFESNKNIKILNLCVSELDGYVDFYISESDPISTISTASKEWINESRFNNTKYNSPIKVKSISIDSMISEYGVSNYTKIDVEGYEYEIIKGIKKNIGLLSFEWVEEMILDIKNSLYHLKSIGYNEFFITYDDDYKFIPNNYMSYDEIVNEVSKLDNNRKEKWGMIFSK